MQQTEPVPEPIDDGQQGQIDHAAVFTRYRGLLFTLAYEITGSAGDAEDVVQDSYLRWADADLTAVQHPKAYLVQIVTRQSLNKLRSAARRKEDYVGPWLPEPVLTSPDIADDAVLADAVSMAMLVVLESLTPDERAVFVLREVFGFTHDEIADAVGKSSASVRQIAHRALQHVQARRPRYDAAPAANQAAVAQFMRAVTTGDLQGLMDTLAPDSVLLSDGGGIKQAALRPILGADKIARFLLGTVAKGLAAHESPRVDAATVNTMPGALFWLGEELDTAAMVHAEGGRIVGVYLVRNPHKLTGLDLGQHLSRTE